MRFEPPIAGFLADGDPVPGAPGWHVVAADGHSDCSIAYHHPESATLLSGDAVVTLDGRAWFNPEWVDEEACRRTEERLRALAVDHLLPGHGRPVHGDVWSRAIPFGRPPPGRVDRANCSTFVSSRRPRRRNDTRPTKSSSRVRRRVRLSGESLPCIHRIQSRQINSTKIRFSLLATTAED